MEDQDIKRDEKLLDIRPKLSIQNSDQTSEIERFQNQTLRPILKFQNDYLVDLLEINLVKRKAKIDLDSKKTIYDNIEQMV